MEEFQKVSVGLSGVIHLSRMAGHRTLCGRQWWADNNHGDFYCQSCQSALSRLTQRPADSERVRDRKRVVAAERKLKKILGLQ